VDTTIIAATEPKSTYADLATFLHSIADCIDASPVRDQQDPYVMLSILPSGKHDEPIRVAQVDALLKAILGKPGEPRPNGDTWQHSGRGSVGPVEVSIHTRVVGPQPDEVQAELIRLRARVAELEREQESYPDPVAVA
jgi:hypothetical protein